MYVVVMFLYAVCPPFENTGVHNYGRIFSLPLSIPLFSNSQSKNSKILSPESSPEPFVSRAKAPPAKRSEKGYGCTIALMSSVVKMSYDVTEYAWPIVLCDLSWYTRNRTGKESLLQFCLRAK